MYIPLVRDRVCVNGHSGEFLVVWADYRHNHADLVSRVDNQVRLTKVPFENLFATWEVLEQEQPSYVRKAG